MIIGYARVSTTDQNLDAQTDALTPVGAERLFSQRVSGAKAEGPEPTENLVNSLVAMASMSSLDAQPRELFGDLFAIFI